VIALGVGAFVVGAAPFLRARRSLLVRRTIPVMGTVAEVGVVHGDPRYAHAAIDAAFAELRRIERLMTRFTVTSDVGRANASAATDAVPVSDETGFVLTEALSWAERSEGRFDPCLARAVTLWDVERRSAPPAEVEVRRLAGRALYRALDLDRGDAVARVRFTDPDVAIDLGGIGKGYGVDRAVSALREWGIRRGLVNVGGDLYAMGSSEDDDPWTVGIRSADDPRMLSGKITVSDAAVATSGDYLRAFHHGGRVYHHLLDPSTGAPRVTAVHSVTVRGPTCLAADVAATAVFGLPAGEATALLSRSVAGLAVV
jgi:thiamine biosynthesis lipoprotein